MTQLEAKRAWTQSKQSDSGESLESVFLVIALPPELLSQCEQSLQAEKCNYVSVLNIHKISIYF